MLEHIQCKEVIYIRNSNALHIEKICNCVRYWAIP